MASIIIIIVIIRLVQLTFYSLAAKGAANRLVPKTLKGISILKMRAYR